MRSSCHELVGCRHLGTESCCHRCQVQRRMIAEPIGQRRTLPICLKITWFVLQATTEGKYNSVNGTFCVSRDVTIVALRNVIKKYQGHQSFSCHQGHQRHQGCKLLCMLMTITTSKKSAVLEKRRKAEATNASMRETDQ